MDEVTKASSWPGPGRQISYHDADAYVTVKSGQTVHLHSETPGPDSDGHGSSAETHIFYLCKINLKQRT